MRTAEYEFYHGVVLHKLCSVMPNGVSFEAFDFSGRLDTFRIDGKVAIHIKHSTARITPWNFTFNSDALRELIEVRKRLQDVFVVLVCGDDGVVTLSLSDFVSVSEMRPGGAVPLRVSRDRNTMYRITGNLGELPRRKRSGLAEIVLAVTNASEGEVKDPLTFHSIANAD